MIRVRVSAADAFSGDYETRSISGWFHLIRKDRPELSRKQAKHYARRWRAMFA